MVTVLSQKAQQKGDSEALGLISGTGGKIKTLLRIRGLSTHYDLSYQSIESIEPCICEFMNNKENKHIQIYTYRPITKVLVEINSLTLTYIVCFNICVEKQGPSDPLPISSVKIWVHRAKDLAQQCKCMPGKRDTKKKKKNWSPQSCLTTLEMTDSIAESLFKKLI